MSAEERRAYRVIVTGTSGENIVDGYLNLLPRNAARVEDKLRRSVEAKLISGWFLRPETVAPVISTYAIARAIQMSFREFNPDGTYKGGIPWEVWNPMQEIGWWK